MQSNNHNQDSPTPNSSVVQQQQAVCNSTSLAEQQQLLTTVCSDTSEYSSPNDQQHNQLMTLPESIISVSLQSADSSTQQEKSSAVVGECEEEIKERHDAIDKADEPRVCGDEEITAGLTTTAEVEPAATLTTSLSNTDEPGLALLACQLFRFQCLTTSTCSSSSNNGADEERAVEAAIKGLSQFSHYTNIDINYQGETIHGMVNDEETHISPLGKNADQLSSFRNRRGKVFYVTDLHPNRSCADALVVIAWKANIKDTFGMLHLLSFDDYIFCLENR